MTLHEELTRIADTAPVADVPLDTWDRGRRARRRDTALVAAGTAVVVLVLLGLVRWSADVVPHEAQPAGGSQLGVPDHIYDVEGAPEVESDLAVGRAAAAYLTTDGTAVVVGADDGSYHLLDLPGQQDTFAYSGDAEVQPAFALSPDGRQLAYAWLERPRATEGGLPTGGLRLLDLESGTVADLSIPGDPTTYLADASWSANGQFLAWSAGTIATYQPTGTGSNQTFGPATQGVIDTRTGASSPAVGNLSQAAVSVTDDGHLAVLGGDGANRVLVDRGTSILRGRFGSGGGEWRATLVDPVGSGLLAGDETTSGLTVLDLEAPEVEGEGLPQHRTPGELLLDGATTVGVRPIGFLDDSHVVAFARVGAEEPGPGGLFVIDLRTNEARDVGETDEHVMLSLTLATDLMTLDRPTVSRPAPDWPWTTRHQVVVGGLAGLAVLVAAAVLVIRRRRTSVE